MKKLTTSPILDMILNADSATVEDKNKNDHIILQGIEDLLRTGRSQSWGQTQGVLSWETWTQRMRRTLHVRGHMPRPSSFFSFFHLPSQEETPDILNLWECIWKAWDEPFMSWSKAVRNGSTPRFNRDEYKTP